jgi:hypothetical protein
MRRLQRLQPILLQIREAQDFRLLDGELGQGRPQAGYKALHTAIEKLKHQAEMLRKAEASRAIRWIKRTLPSLV